jgi:hypothetical protein
MTNDDNFIRYFLKDHDPQVQTLFWHVLRLLRDTLPGTKEVIDSKRQALIFTTGASFQTGETVMITPSQDHVQIGFVNGDMLDDPHGLLQGDADCQRQVPIQSYAMLDANAPALRGLILQQRAYTETDH